MPPETTMKNGTLASPVRKIGWPSAQRSFRVLGQVPISSRSASLSVGKATAVNSAASAMIRDSIGARPSRLAAG